MALAHIRDATLPTTSLALAHIRDATLPTSSLALAHIPDATLPTSSLALAHIPDATLPTSSLALAHIPDATLQMGWGGVGWGGLITFNGTSTHTWCYASGLFSALAHIRDATLPTSSLALAHAETLRANMQWKCCARKKTEKSEFFVVSLWRNANPSKNKASWNSLFLRLVFTKACKYKWKMMKK